MKTEVIKVQNRRKFLVLTKRVSRVISKSILLILAVLVIGIPADVFSQQKKMTRKEKEAAWRAERLKKRAAEERSEYHNDSIAFAQAIVAIRNGSWALEASNVTLSNGASNFVTPSTNYVSINNGIATIQTAFDNTNIYSPNGLGGITLEGRVNGEELKMDKSGNVIYNYNIQGSNVSATVSIIITANTNQATAYISPNFNNNTLTLNGSIYPYNSSGVIEGSVSY